MNKYHNIKTAGYASKKEAKRAAELKLLERAGKISNLAEQVKFELLPSQTKSDGKKERKIDYIADFCYTENGKYVVCDVKGFRTADYVIKRKMMLYFHKIEIRET